MRDKLLLMKKILFISTLVIFLHSCGGFFKPDWSKTAEPDGKKRAQQNVREGKGFNFGFGSGTKETNFTFASSNPLWRATLDILDFLPLSTVDYSGGVIISDWYTDNSDKNQALKITVRFLSNKVQTNSVKVTVHRKKCSVNQACNVELFKSRIGDELIASILKEAAILEKQQKK